MISLKTYIEKVFSKESFSKAISFLWQHQLGAGKRNILFFICMVVIIALSICVRILPLRWGLSLSEFDPYFQYDVTNHIVENGLFSWRNWHMDDMWFPQGRDVAYTSFPGFPMTGAVLYSIISFLGFNISVMDATILFPIVFSAITCIIAYYLGKEIGGSGVGLLSALLLALNPAYINRTNLGFYDDETVGVFGIILASLFYLRSLKKEGKWQISLAYALAGGATLGYVFSSWGASRYLLSLFALYTFFLVIAKTSSRRLLLSYGALMGVGLSVAMLVPKLGLKFITEFECVAAIGVFLLLTVLEISQHFSEKRRNSVLVLLLAGLGVIAMTLSQFGFISLPVGKFISVINPFERVSMPLIESVQEHQPATVAAFYYQFGALIFLGPLGILFALRKATYDKIFIVTYALTMLYFAASLIRLTVLLAPALCILGALAIVEIMKSFTELSKQRVLMRRRPHSSPGLGKSFGALMIIILFIITLLPLGRGIDSADSPTTISSSSLPIRSQIGDWTESLVWMKDNLPEDAVVASWWDYGYWISVLGDKVSLADNGTFNGTQIAWIGRMFMSTEEDAIIMMKDFNSYAKGYNNSDKNISYVVVFTTIGLASSGQYLFGDEVKWRWMAKIGWNSSADAPLEDLSISSQLADYWASQTSDTTLQQWYTQFKQNVYLPKADRVLTKLMMYGAFGTTFDPLGSPQHFQLVFSSSRKLVFVYQVLY